MFDGIFGDMFDFNGDGKLDDIEQAAELGFIIEASRDDESEDVDLDDYLI